MRSTGLVEFWWPLTRGKKSLVKKNQVFVSLRLTKKNGNTKKNYKKHGQWAFEGESLNEIDKTTQHKGENNTDGLDHKPMTGRKTIEQKLLKEKNKNKATH